MRTHAITQQPLSPPANTLFALAFVLAVFSAYENIYHSSTLLPNSAAFEYFSASNVSRTGKRATLDDLFARNVNGDELKLELLHKYASENHTALSYSQVWEALEAVDGGLDIYTGVSWPVGKSAGMRCGKMQREAGRKAGRCFNREHAWPKSWWGGFEKGGPASTDLFALFLVDEEANSKRGNLPFGLVREQDALYTSASGAKMGPCQDGKAEKKGSEQTDQADFVTGKVKFFNAAKKFGFITLPDGREAYVHASKVAKPHVRASKGGANSPNSRRALRAGDRVSLKVTSNHKGLVANDVELLQEAPGSPALCFEPPDEFKGDLARAIFYMSVRYLGAFQCCDNQAVTRSRINPAMEAVLRQWHRQDPVSAREKERARRITAGWQHNSNPFILIPALVDRVDDF